MAAAKAAKQFFQKLLRLVVRPLSPRHQLPMTFK
jgi:hypothetical protein